MGRLKGSVAAVTTEAEEEGEEGGKEEEEDKWVGKGGNKVN